MIGKNKKFPESIAKVSLPSFINLYSDNFLSNENLIQDLNNTYLLSLKDTSGLSEKSTGVNLRDDSLPTPIESFETFVDFNSEVKDKLTQESAATINTKTANVCKVLRNSIVENHVRNAVQFTYNSTERLYNPVCVRSEVHTQIDALKEHALAPWNFDKLPGNNPQNWPVGLDTLNERLKSLPELNFFYEPFDLNESFKTKSKQFIDITLAKIKKEGAKASESEDINHLVAALDAILTISFHTGSFHEIMSAIKLLNDISEDLAKSNISITEQLHRSFSPVLEKIKAFAQETTYLHHLETFCDEGGFKIPKMTYFQKQSFFNTSVATDGAYIYIYVSSSNGGMYKIGTGERGTTTGRIYAFAGINKTEEVSWVFCKGKLYLRNSSKEMGTLEIVCPNTFKVEGCLQIYCPDIFGHPSLQLINRNYPLLTDGEHVYIIGKKLLSEKINNEPKPELQAQKSSGAASGEVKEEGSESKKEAAHAEKKEEQRKPKKAAPVEEKEEEPEKALLVEEEIIEKEDIGSKSDIEKSEPSLQFIGDEKPVAEKPAEEKPVEIKPEAEVKLVEEKPAEQKSEEQKPAEAQPVEQSNADAKPVESKPVEEQAAQPKIEEEKAAEEKAVEEKAAEVKPVPEKSAEEKAAEPKAAEAEKEKPKEAEKEKEKEKKEKDEKKAPLRKDIKKEPRKKKELKKLQENENEQTLKLCEFILYEFDITDTKGLDFIDQSETYDKELIQELYESFNGYFTFNECARALSYNKDDIQNAAQWLVDEGDRERSKKTVLVKNTTLLAQAEVTSDISTKHLKNNVELVTKEDSVIFPNNVSMNIWTMNKTHVALYCESGIKVFSKDPKDVHVLSDIVNEKEADKNQPFEFRFNPPAYSMPTRATGFGSGFGMPPEEGGLFGSTTSSSNNAGGGGLFGGGTYSSLFGGAPSNPPSGGGFLGTFIKQPATTAATTTTSAAGGLRIMKDSKEFKGDVNAFKKIVQDQLGEIPDEGKGTFDISQKISHLSKDSQDKYEPPAFKVKEIFKSQAAPAEKKEAKEPAVAPAKVEKKINVELKGTYIKTFDKNKKAYYTNQNFHICYDPYNKKFYTFTWIWDAHTNIFPSLITLSYDPERYNSSKLHHITLTPTKNLTNCTLEDYANKLVEEMLILQKSRFFLPHRLRNWDYLYGWALTDIHNKKGMLGSSNEEEKKKITAQKAKLQQRLSKVAVIEKEQKKNEDYKPLINKKFVEVKKEYAFSMDGSLDTLKIIIEMLKTKENVIEQCFNDLQLDNILSSGVYPYLNLLSYWVKHADVLINYQEKEPAEVLYIENFLYNILSNDVHTAENLKKNPELQKLNILCWRILVNGWELLVRTSQKQFKWFQLVIQSVGKYQITDLKDESNLTSECLNQDGYSPLVYLYFKFAHYPDSIASEFPLKDFQVQTVKPAELFDNSDEKGQNNITRRSQVTKVRENNLVEPYGRLLIDDLSYLEYVKAYPNQFEDLYNSYFINENQEALKIEKSNKEEAPQDKPADKLPAKQDKKTKKESKAVKETPKATKEIKTEGVIKTEKEKDSEKVKKVISIDKDIRYSHEESSRKFLEILEKALCDAANSPTLENVLLWKILLKLVYDSWNEYEKIEEGDVEWKHKMTHTERIFSFLERVLEHYSQKFSEIQEKSPAIAAKLIEYISTLVSSLSYLIYQSAVTKNFGCEEIAYTLIRIYSKLSKFMEFQDDKGKKANILEHIITHNDEGIDYLNEKVLETNHPYERGRGINFDPLVFPGAVAISVEFDKRCQSDVSHDFISLSSGYDSTYSNIGYFMNHREAIGTSFRISGKPNLKKPLVMLGNCLQVDFTPSGQVKDEHSLNRWGFKLKVRPVYGVGNYIIKDGNFNSAFTAIQSKFGGEKAFTDFVTALAVLNLLTMEIIELHVKGAFLSDHEKQLKKYLKWNLFKGGISGVELSQLLTTKNGMYYARNNREYQDLENYTFDDKFEALKEEIYLRIAKYNSRKDTNKENEEKIVQELFNLKDPLLSSFVNDIKEQKGDFLEFVNKLRQIVPIPMMLKAEKMRKTFSDQYKLMWEQAEGYMLLAFLHHSGLLKFIANENHKIEISAEPYITDQLNQLGQKRNDVFNWMLNQIQSEREWQHTLEEISEFRNKYLDEKAKVEEEKNKKNEEESKKEQEKDTKDKEKKAPAPDASKASMRSTGLLPAKKGSKISVRPSSRTSSDFFKASKTKPTKTRTKYAEDQPAEGTSKPRKKESNVDQEEEKTYTEDEEEEKSDVEIKPPKDSLDFEEKLDEIILKELSSRFEGHSDALRMVCSLKNIDLNKDSSQLLRDLYEICKSNLKEFKKDPKNNHYILEFKSPYEIVAQNTIETSLFLVKLNSPFKKDESSPVSPSSKPEKGSINEFPNDEDDDDDLKRPNMHRSLSSAPESQISDTTAKLRLKNLRELVNAYQQWKEWHKKEAKESDEYYLSEHASPLKSVVSLITAKLNSKKLELCLKNHVSRASQRIVGLQMASVLFEHVINTPFERYLFGLLTQVFAEDHLSNVNCAPQEFGQVIEVYLNELLGKFLISFNNKMEAIKAIKLTHLNSLLIKTKGVSSGLLKWKSIIQQSLSGLSCNLRDIIAIISNLKIFKRLLNTEDSKLQETVKSFFENVFLLTLLGKSLTYLSLACEHLVTISNNCNQLVLYLLFLVQKLNHSKSMNSILEIIADLFKKEIGLKKEGAATQYQLNARVLQRAHDILVIERLQFLLTSAHNILEKVDVSKLNKSTLGELAFLTFTLTYHHNAPALLRPAHKLAQQLSHYLEFNTLSTPYDISYYYYQYADYENMQKAVKSQIPYKFEPNELVYKAIDVPKLDSSVEELSYNNALALLEKIGDRILMKKEEGIHMKNIVDNNLLKNEAEKARTYSVLVHLGNEEDLSFLLKVLYYWEEKNPTFTLKYPKTVEEYHKYKEHLSKKEAEKVKGSADKAQGSTHPANESYFKDNEKIFANLPHYNLITKDEDELPIAWMFNMLNNYSDCKIGKFDLKKSKTRKTVRKVWNNTNLNKLEKKMEEAQKTIEEFKEEDPEEAKLQVVAARSFIWRIQQHLKEVLYIAAMLNIFGFSPILDSMPQEKAMDLANLINLGMQKKLKNIPVAQFEKEEIRKKLDPHSLQAPPQNPGGKAPKPVEPEKDQKSEMRISFVESRYVPLFETNMDFITGLNVPKESLYVDCNKIPVIHTAGLQGSSTTILVDELINYTRSLLAIENVNRAVIPQIQKVIDIFAKKQVEELTSLEKSLFIGITAVIGGWTDMVKPGANILYEGSESSSLVMTQGGQSSGKKTCSIISKDEPSLVAQTVPLEKMHPQLQTDLPSAINIHPRAIIKSFKLLHEHFDKQKENAEEKNIETSILLRAILRVSKALDWCRLIQESEVDKDDLTHFLNFLLRLAAHVPADHGHEHYENIFGKSWEYLIDKREPKSYTFFFPEDFPTDKLECEVDEPSPQLENLKKRQSQGPIVVENLLPNSQYISSLPEYQPLVSEYKMLKYWEKHIIPKIQDFVRSSYKPYEFEEFFEQLRQPLRKGDHTKAAEIAYILCDQRLPNGCVLPDANHDWSTVSVEEIVLGTWAIASINNKQNKPLSPFFQYQHRIGNKDACVYLIAADTKSSSVLANYYDHENLQVVSVWLPVACVKLPEVPLDPPAASFAKNKILEDFRSSIITSMAFLARGTILKFFSFNSTQTETFKKEADLMRSYSFSIVNLIKWSVLEELAEDPLEGWLHVNEWEILMQGQRKKPSLQNPSELINEVSQEENLKKPTTKLQALKGLIKHLASTDEIEDILSWLKDNFLKLVEFINMNASQFDLQRPYAEAAAPQQNSNRSIYYLNNCLPDVTSDDSIAALTVSFKKESQLCMHSGIKFYDDPKGVNMIQHLPAGKEVRTKLPSLLFKQSKVWFSYYFNSEAIPPYLLDQCHSTLQAVVHAIPSRWSVCLWTADALSTAFLQSKNMKSYEHMKRLISIVMEALQQFQGPMSIENLIFKFLNRCARKMRYLVNSLPELRPQIDIKNSDLAAKENFRLLNVDAKWLKSIVEQIKRLREYQSSDMVVLYSSFTQELIEYVTNCLLPASFFEKTSLSCSSVVKELNIPDWLGCVIDTALFIQFFKGESELTEDLLRETVNNMKLDSQWDKVIYIQDLPLECTKEEITEKIKEIILANKGRILNVSRDIFFPTVKDENGVEKHTGKCLVLLDGRSTFELEDEEEKEKEKEEAQPVEEEEEEGEPELWSCPTCTLENARESPFCDACETPKPAFVRKPAAEPIEEQVKHTDLAEMDQKLKQKEKESLDKIGEQIKEFANEYYEKLKTRVKELEEKEKVQTEKQQEVQQNVAVPVEQKANEADTAEARKEKNKKKKQELKDLKKKAQEEKQQKKQDKKKGKGKKDDKKEEEEQEEVQKDKHEEKPAEKVEEVPKEAVAQEIPEKKEQVEPQPVVEVPPTPEQIERKRLEAILADQKKPTVLVSGEVATNQQSQPVFQDFLKKRLFASDQEKLLDIATKTLVKIFNQLKQSASRLIPQYQKSIQDIDISDIQTISSDDFIARIAKEASKNPQKVWRFLEICGYDLWYANASFNVAVEAQKDSKLVPIKALEQLMNFLQIDLCKENKSVLNYPPANIRILTHLDPIENEPVHSLNYEEEALFPVKYGLLSKYPLVEIRYSWALIKTFNKNLAEAIDFISTYSAIPYNFEAKWFNLGTYLSAFRNLWMTPIKIELSQKIMHKTAIARDHVPKVTIERLKNVAEKEKQTTTSLQHSKEIVSYKIKEEFIFTKSYEQLKDVSATLFRPIKPGGSDPFLAFEVIFKGELAMGEAGPYRQFFADISQELQPNNVSLASQYKNLNLLVPSPNNYAKLGEGRDNFVINPSAKTSYHLQLYEFLGILMGCSVRTGTHLTLDLPTLFWKQLVNQPITIEDLEEIDKPLTDLVRFMGECTKEVFEESFFENYVTMLSDKSLVELKPGGAKIRVKFEDRFEYISRILHVRVTESKQQIDCIRRGLTKLVPLPFLNIISANDLEIWVCGKSLVDVPLLQRHTKYSGSLNEESPSVKFLWEVLKELSDIEKLRFVKFCWGQERLPANDEEFERTQTRFMIKPSTLPETIHDRALPKADTCFFNLELPKYSTKAILKEKLLLAINTDCDSINADQLVNLDPNAQYNRGNDFEEIAEDEE